MNDAWTSASTIANVCVAVAATGIAAWLRPWKAMGTGGPPLPWLVAWAVMPLLWALDRYAAVPVAQPLSGAVMLVLLAGWPMAMLALVPVAAITMVASQLSGIETLHRLVWLGIAPATLALVIGAGLRRWLPHQLFVYILGRGFFGTFAACALSSGAAIALHESPVGTGANDLFVAHVLGAFAEATLTGMLTAILVAYRPQALATYTDRLYLPPRPSDGPAP